MPEPTVRNTFARNRITSPLPRTSVRELPSQARSSGHLYSSKNLHEINDSNKLELILKLTPNNNFWFKISREKMVYLYTAGECKVDSNTLGVNWLNYQLRQGESVFWQTLTFFRYCLESYSDHDCCKVIDFFLITNGIGAPKEIIEREREKRERASNIPTETILE